MKYLKYFENNTENIQQPFYLTDHDYLYLSNELAKKIAPNFNNKKGIWSDDSINRELQKQIDFFNNTRNDKNQLIVRYIYIDKSVTWNNNSYSMRLSLYNSGYDRDTKFGNFRYYLIGNSGDSEMHGKNMVRGTRDSNINFIIKLYPIVKYIKNFYKILKTKEKGFLEIIKDAILKDRDLIKHGVPNELLDDKDIGYLVYGEKYNL
jgi:hypothetical protein